MEVLEKIIDDIHDFLQKKLPYKLSMVSGDLIWPSGEKRNIVLNDDMAVELGNPNMDSLSCIVWSEHANKIRSSHVSVVGPDIPESFGKSLPFGKIVLVAVKGFNEENTYDRYRDMEMIRYSIDLKGYMVRAVSQYQQEWSRISKEAFHKGFSFEILGKALIKEFLKRDYISAVEVIFVTSCSEDVKALKAITSDVRKVIQAMDKMVNELTLDCNGCDYREVCDEVVELKKMKIILVKKSKEVI
jgi:CO dehydrogenase/acetyl-CoA synthase beta subunit